jgi:predicted metal-dependent peptidase
VSARALTKLAAARARLVLDRPFIGALALHLDFRPADARWCETLATDARHVYFNPAFVEAVPFAELQFWLAHEALHCALGHFARRSHRVRRRWDVACDHAVNLMLRDDGLVLPAGALADPAFRGLSAEEIYPLVPEDTCERSFDRHAFERDDAGTGLPGFLGERRIPAARSSGPVSPSADGRGEQVPEGADDAWDDAGVAGRRHRPGGADAARAPEGAGDPLALEQLWKSRLAAAAQAAREAGRLGASWLRHLEQLIEPALPWRALLARHVYTVAREDYSFQRPPRREGAALLPRLARGAIRLVAVLDTSGSITGEELAEFAGELDALKSQVSAHLTVHACDERLADGGPWTFDAWQPLALPAEIPGGGGTRFTPVFEWIEAEAVAPDLLIYFTDAQGEFPEAPPPYPVLWLVKGRAPVPFGERVQLN